MKESKFDYRVVAKTNIMATHHWPNAPDGRAYLRSLHAHMFNITGVASIDFDREIEFHDLKEMMDMAVMELTIKNTTLVSKGKLPSFGSMSCESIAQYILTRCPVLDEVTVFEDESCGSTVQQSGLDRPLIVTICGSTKFKEEYRKAEKDLELQGYAVMSVGSFPHAEGSTLDPDIKIALDILHKQKIAMSDAIYVINPNGYIGESTASEIQMARKLGKAVIYMEKKK